MTMPSRQPSGRPSESSGDAVRDRWTFLKAWMRRPQDVASIYPSSERLRRQLSHRDCIRSAGCVIELGPGTGETTSALLDSMPAHSRLLAVEKTEYFIDTLHDISDPRLDVWHGDAVHLPQIAAEHGIRFPDVIVSGIPFSRLSAPIAIELMRGIHQLLPVGGKFIAYQLRDRVCEFARPFFGRSLSRRVWFNVPPLRVYSWTKSSTTPWSPELPRTVVES
ncbi:SAM-dependent methyltransferase [Roseiconus nitratireducens]|uniref:SAM-dependent methyltransferase n=1 Tax=Roseiconus nitratireducens TaxID=2605748 RepID=A0A5M6D517_9BACT|nr:SAM-dependent methyltransferase [Roseiconus nitratireducens]KAA5542581.1 SAM-dependent methyltransferase [Roseiconus nitratireducens]